jgi:hypothetical protein
MGWLLLVEKVQPWRQLLVYVRPRTIRRDFPGRGEQPGVRRNPVREGLSQTVYCGFGAGLTGVPSRRLSGSSRCARPKLSYARMTRCTK